MIATAAAAAVVLIGVLVGNTLLSDSTRSSTDSGGSRSTSADDAVPCSTPPDVSVTSAQLTSSGLSVSTLLTANCGEGDVVTDPSFGLTISDGGRDVAAATFDTRSDPIVILPGETAQREFVFPDGMFWRIPETYSSGAGGLVARSVPSSTGSPVSGPTSDGASTIIAASAMQPANDSPDGAALSALRDITASDRSYISQSLTDRWIPQISSKRPGLVAEGITWTPSDILREHLALRQRYDDVRLIWSGDWTTFSTPDWWVTVVGDPSTDSSTALNWCVSAGLDFDHCFAKIVSASRGVDGTTMMQKR
ncbi:hypothetical protein [Mycolicibacterium arenosum]|uniref:Uncharacterized protein n=1 Tax=Mycolicibacterium arenosum TaxID=2952157 RepID=A0ABT1M457_9MYCO|nr:hypothetical protein [Mycolicibacterium sp. CAU 1645]MCP9273934.1 hypothetical protein [Mycolicibacterium sp. CAU 1645]